MLNTQALPLSVKAMRLLRLSALAHFIARSAAAFSLTLLPAALKARSDMNLNPPSVSTSTPRRSTLALRSTDATSSLSGSSSFVRRGTAYLRLISSSSFFTTVSWRAFEDMIASNSFI